MTHSPKTAATRLREGLAISPLVATALIVLGLLVYSGPAPLESVLLGAMLIAFHGYACELLFGLPLFFLFKRNASVSAWHLLRLGSLGGGLVALLSSILMYPARGTSLREGLTSGLIELVPFGAIIGLMVWCFARRRRGA